MEDTVQLLAAGLEFPLSLQGRVSIGDRVQEIEQQRIEAFTKEELTDTEIAEISMRGMQEKLQQADTAVEMKSALVYLTVRERDGVEGIEIIMVPGDPNQYPVHRFVEVSFVELRQNLTDFRNGGIKKYKKLAYLEPGKFLYDKTILPIYEDLERLNIDHLQIIPDAEFTRGSLSSASVLQYIPYAALVNAGTNEHLIEQFSLAISPSFHLTEPKHHDLRNAEKLVLAESEFGTHLPSLPGALAEFNIVNESNAASIPNHRRFNASNLQNGLNSLDNVSSPQLLHIATHGEFKVNENPDDDYLYTEDPLHPISLTQLLDDSYNFESLELAIFAACRAATGDKSYEYGIGGTIWAKGAESVIGTQWDVSDVGTAGAMYAFYTILSKRDLPIAKILQEVQLAMLESRISVNVKTEVVNNENTYIVTISYTFINNANQEETVTTIVPEPLRTYANSFISEHPHFWAPFQLIGSGH
ncbi:CHAT domain-containing protein [Spirulina sp. 06S082]|uniref:CHAT domain-containing protein n=1 Tax=Spirulina sp. 06S082 TaxID=3110248 RepID=UPI002B1ED353|nr:CHAT domain-containing protein [Spirulina sp. 06S082]MEA5469095.1 CHAT domain-containing protein [Spirulina sp. 06S082]